MNAAPKLRRWRDVRWEERESGDAHQELGCELHAHAQSLEQGQADLRLSSLASQLAVFAFTAASSRRDRDRASERNCATHENHRSDDDAQRPHDEPPKRDVPRGLGVGALHIFASDDHAATEIFVGNLIRPTDVLKVNDAAQFGAILRNSSDARPALSQIEKIQEDLSNLLAACGEVIETTVSTKGHAFVKFKEGAAAERALALHGRDAAYKSTLHGRELVVQAKGKSELHELRKVIGSEAKLPVVERSKSGRNATWTLPDGGAARAPRRCLRRTLAPPRCRFGPRARAGVGRPRRRRGAAGAHGCDPARRGGGAGALFALLSIDKVVIGRAA